MARTAPEGVLTVAGLIESLQRQVEIDPARADQLVIVGPAGERGRYWVAVATGAGSGDDEHVSLIAIRQR